MDSVVVGAVRLNRKTRLLALPGDEWLLDVTWDFSDSPVVAQRKAEGLAAVTRENGQQWLDRVSAMSQPVPADAEIVVYYNIDKQAALFSNQRTRWDYPNQNMPIGWRSAGQHPQEKLRQIMGTLEQDE